MEVCRGVGLTLSLDEEDFRSFSSVVYFLGTGRSCVEKADGEARGSWSGRAVEPLSLEVR